MDQVKIGTFLKELRKEKGLTQEQLAEKFNVAGRTVSRWETGNNLPDLSLLVELADFYDVDIRELIDGERKSETMDTEVKDTLLKVADYAENEKNVLLNRVRAISICGLTGFIFAGLLSSFNMASVPVFDFLIGVLFGIAGGSLVVNVLYLTGILAKLKAKRSKEMKIVRIVSITVMLLAFILSIFASI